MLEKELRANWDNVFYPEPEPEVETFGEEVQPVDDPVLLAAGPSGTMTDAGPGVGAGRPVDTIKAIDPTMRQQLADFLQAGFERLGASRNTARKNAQTLVGGGSSNLPIGMGLADIVPFLGTALQTEEAAIAGGQAVEAVKRGDLGEAGVQAGMAAIGMIPGAAGTVKGVRSAAKGAKAAGKALAPKAGEMLEGYLSRTGQILNVVERTTENSPWILRDEFTAYQNQPRQLQGFKTVGPNKGFDEQKYKHAEFLEVKLDDGTTFYDAIRGLNKPHALSRAFGNWPAASEIRPLTRLEAEKADPSLVKEVDAAMGGVATQDKERK
jgi:hypothetical protein